MNERIQLILKTKNISASKFADEIGVQRSSISHIISGRNNPSLDFIQKTLKRFPDINSSWMLTGKGSMYVEQDLFSDLDELKSEKYKSNKDLNDSQIDIPGDNFNVDEENQLITNESTSQSNLSKRISKTKENVINDTNKEGVEKKIPQSNVFRQLGKKIEKIVIFYSDKSCKEYNPE